MPSLLSNSRWNLFAFACTLGAHVLIVPVVVRLIGLEGYGRAGLVIATWAPLVLVGTVLGQATTREIAARWRSDTPADAQAVASAALVLCSLGCVACGALFLWLGPHLLHALDRGAPAKAWWGEVAALAPGWVAQQFSLVLQSTAAARQDFRTIARISALSALATLVLTLGITSEVPTPQGYLLATSASFAAGALISAVLAWYAAPTLFGLPRWQRDAVAALLHFGKWQTLAQLAGTLGNQMDRYVLATLASPAVIGQFNAANRLQEAAYAGVIKVAEVLLPRFGADYRVDAGKRERLFLVASTTVMVFSGALLTPMIILSEPLMRLWVGPVAADGGALLLSTLVVGGLIACGSNVASLYLMGIGQNAPVAGFSVVYSLLTILLTVLTLKAFGPLAAGVGLALASTVRVALALAWIKVRALPTMRWPDIATSTVLPLALALAAAALGRTLLPVERIQNWWTLGATYVAAMLGTSACTALAVWSMPYGRRLTGEWMASRRRLQGRA